MERLTTFDGNKWDRATLKIKNQDLINKLAAYEDAEEQGLLLRLPYNLATCGVLYFACEEDSEIYRLNADKIEISKTMISNKFLLTIDSLDFCLEDFGRIVFITKAEAEKALEEMWNG